MDNKDPLKEISKHLSEVKRYDEIEANLINTKTSIEENSDDFKFFATAICGCIECHNAIAEKFNVSSIPRVFLYKNGEKLYDMTGFNPDALDEAIKIASS